MNKFNLKLFVMRMAALGLGFIAAFALLEIGLRLYPIESRVRGETIVLPANKKYTFEDSQLKGNDQVITHAKNSLGFRGAEQPQEDFDDYLSIMTVGGSTTECFYLSDSKDWPAVLGHYLQNDFGSVWLNNAGLDGHSTFGHTILLKDHILEMKPKVVLFLVGLNDVGLKDHSSFASSHIKGKLRFDSIDGFVKSASVYSEVAALILNLSRYVRAKFMGLPHRNLDVMSLPRKEFSDSEVKEKIKLHKEAFLPAYKSRLQNMIRIAKDAQIDPVLITQPSLLGEGIDPSTGVDLSTLDHLQWKILELYNDATIKIGTNENVLTIDLATELVKDSAFFYDLYHFTNEGSEEVARIIHKHLRPFLIENYKVFFKKS